MRSELPAGVRAVALLAVPATTPGVGPERLVDYWPTVVRVGWFLAVVGVGRLVVEPALVRVVHRRNRNNPTLREAVRRYARVLVLLVAAFVGAGVAGYGRFLGTAAVALGAATLAVGVAAQQVVGSVVSGVALVFDPEFNVGDYIEWSGGAGVVRSITLRVTHVETRDGAYVTVPNTVLTGEAVTRPFGRGSHRVVERFGVAYETDVSEALSHLEAAADGIEEILAEPSPRAYVDELGSDAVVVRVHYWLSRRERDSLPAVRSAYVREAKARLEGAGITVSPPAKRDLRGRIRVDDGE
jgi:small-conductance mechanosensitive channel